MESIITTIAPYLAPIDLILMVIIAWQFFSAWQKDKSISEAFRAKDQQAATAFSVLNIHTDAINRLLGFLDGQRRVV